MTEVMSVKEDGHLEKSTKITQKSSCLKKFRVKFFCPIKTGPSKSVPFDWKLLKNPLLLLYGLSAFFFFCGYPGLFIIIAPHSAKIGYSKKDAAFLLSIMGIADIVGRLATGWFADMRLLRGPNIVAITQTCACIATVIVPSLRNYVGIAVLCWMHGMFTGAFMSIMPFILAESLGVLKVASSLGLIGLFMGAGVFVSPPTVGKLFTVFRLDSMVGWCEMQVLRIGGTLLNTQSTRKNEKEKRRDAKKNVLSI